MPTVLGSQDCKNSLSQLYSLHTLFFYCSAAHSHFLRSSKLALFQALLKELYMKVKYTSVQKTNCIFMYLVVTS